MPLGYHCAYMRVDTKQYYIPHTRTRVYLVATCGPDPSLPRRIMEKVREMERPASASLEAFLLPHDDPRVMEARRRLSARKAKSETVTDWSKCEARHQRCRTDEQLGHKRPYTDWRDGGACQLPDYAWRDWGNAQTERVLDLIDIDYLREAALHSVDAKFKTKVRARALARALAARHAPAPAPNPRAAARAAPRRAERAPRRRAALLRCPSRRCGTSHRTSTATRRAPRRASARASRRRWSRL